MAEVPEKDEQSETPTLSFNSLTCNRCKEPFSQDRPAKLLSCLHTFCGSCLELDAKNLQAANNREEDDISTDSHEKVLSSTFSKNASALPAEKTAVNEDEGKTTHLKCCECNVEYTEDLVITNPFIDIVKKIEPRTEDGSPSEGKFPTCTSCDDNQKASSFCKDCQEWLCDPCVIAHKRVRITKDHTISNKVKPDEMNDGNVGDSSKPRNIYCKTHKTETLKLFCLTCETLTCRDCQLNEHKDHKYQYIEETLEKQKSLLKEGINELKVRLESNQELSDKIAEKEKDIKKQQVEVFTEVRQVADMVTNELISWCKQLLNFLQGVCHGRVKDLTYKKKEADSFAKRAKHTIDFVESALQSGDDLSVLHAKSLMSKNLNALKNQNINVQNSMFDLNIKYENDAKYLTKNVSKMGFINVNGKSYPQHAAADPPAPNEQQSLHNVTKDNFSQSIADLLNKQPVHVREKYKSFSVEKRKQFLQQLMQTHMRQQQVQRSEEHRQIQAPHTAANRNGSLPSNQPRLPGQQFNSDNHAIQDLYGTSSGQPGQQVRPAGTFYPDNMMQQNRAQQQQHIRPNPMVHGPSFLNWRGGSQQPPGFPGIGQSRPGQVFSPPTPPGWSASQSLANLMNISTNGSMNTSHNTSQGSKQRPGFPGQPGMTGSQFGAVPQARLPNPGVIPGNQLPPGRIDIDPLNLRGGQPTPLRVKQEPKERGDFSSSCQFDKQPASLVKAQPLGSVPLTDSIPQLQSPPMGNYTSPSHTPSPGHTDGAPRTSVSPASSIPDINQAMDNDRNELLRGLTTQSGNRNFNPYHLHPKHDPTDPSEDYCGVCHNGGDLLCCDRCPKVFHLQCHVPAISSNLSSSEVWNCCMCVEDEELVIDTPIPREFELTSTGKRKAPNGLVDKEIKVCERILLELFCCEISTVFHEPVPKSVPNYHKIIQQPMDFGTIKCKLRRGHFAHYNTVEEFVSDVKLVFRNCFKFNPASSDIHQIGKNVENLFEALVKHFLPCYLDHLHRRTPSPVAVQGLVESNGGDAPRNKKRRSPAPDASRDTNSPLHIF